MARVRVEGHAYRGQEGHVDSQNKPDFSSPAEWKDPFSAYADTGTPD